MVISSFPPYGETHHGSVVGVATYAKNTLLAVAKNLGDGEKITVLAEKLEQKDQETHEKNLEVKRIWQKNSLFIFPQILREILKAKPKPRKIVIEFEMAMFGSGHTLLFFLPFLLLLKILKKKHFLVLHQVVTDINDLAGHINVKPKGLKTKLINFCLRLYYRLLIFLSFKVIVFEETLKNKLLKYDQKQKIVVIPHGVEEFPNTITKKEARKKLNLPENRFVIMAFGFLAWYKGTDLLFDSYNALDPQTKKKCLFLIAGGPNKTRLNFPFYQKYVTALESKAKQNGIKITGFVKEEEIPLYFTASDLTVFPYRTFMSASGPLSMAFSFKKPFLLSQKLQNVTKNKDFESALKTSRLKTQDFTFANQKDLALMLKKLIEDKNKQKRLENLASEMKQQRSWQNISTQYISYLLQ